MAKQSDHLAGLEAEDTGGLFSTLLAEEDEYDRRRTLWRLTSWGVASVAAVVVAVMANQSSLGWRRDQAATADLVQQANRLQAVARDSQNDARRLASAVETLNSDRDRLYTRVTMLEQGLDSVTGAIARQNPAPAAPAIPSDPQPAAPAVAPVATTPAAAGEKAAASAAVEPAPSSTAAVARNTPSRPAATPATPLVESKSMMAPPDPAAGKLIEPGKPASPIAAAPMPAVMAAAPPAEAVEADPAETSLPKVQRTEFGVDVGGANSIAGLRALWRGLLKSRANAPLAALQPIIVIREGTGGFGMQLRLVAGPLGDAAAAAKLCAVLTENDRHCETSVYDGQRLAMKADDAPAPSAKPAAPPPRKRTAPTKRAVVEEPKKPETSSTLSSFFSRRSGQ